MALSNYWKDRICKHVLRESTMGANGGCHVSLHTADPGVTGASEVTGGTYGRQSVSGTGTYPTAATTSITNSAAAITFTLMPACTVTHVGFWDAATTGNFLQGQILSASKAVNANDTFQFPTSTLTISYADTKGFSDYLSIQLLKHLLLQATFGQPAANYVALFTADPGETGASNECTGGAGPYARQVPSFAALSANSGAKLLNAALNFTGMPACTVNYMGIFDAVTTGNFLFVQTVAALSKTVNAGDTFQVPGSGTGMTVTVS